MKCKIYYKDSTIFEGEWFQAPHLKGLPKIIHREGGPAVESANGTKEWFLNGNLHRTDGPAIETTKGTKYWYLNDKLHREDGPAMEWEDGYEEWYLNGEELHTLTQEYLIRYMELTGETLATLLLHPDEIIRDSVKKYKWSQK